MKLAIVEIILGLKEWIFLGDKRRLWQCCHYIKRGFIIIFTLGLVNPEKREYYNEET